MSNLNKRVLAAALAAVIATPAAFAATVTATGNNHAFELTATAPVTATNNAAISYNLVAGDILIGRQQASGNVNIRLDLVGAQFATAPTITLAAGQGTLIGAPVFAGSTLTFVIEPPALTPGMIAGPLFSIAPGGLSVTAATALSNLGGNVNVTIDARDVTSGLVLVPAASGTVFTSARSSGISFGALTTSIADVTVTPGKSRFQLPAVAPVVDDRNVLLGTITFTPRATANVSARGSGFAGNTNLDNLFQFNVAGAASIPPAAATRDRANVAINFLNDAGFSNVYLTTGACVAGTGAITPAAGTLSALTDGGSTWSGAIDLSNDVAANVFNVCARVNGTTPIEQQTITAQAGIDFVATGARDIPLGAATDIHTIGFNGTSINVFHINPATNAAQESYIRVTNRSTTGGTVRITGTCDSGAISSTEVAFNLAGGNSIQLSSSDLENGSAKTNNTRLTFGTACAGKRRINVTGEFAPMSVQNFLRNANTGGTVNTNINNDN